MDTSSSITSTSPQKRQLEDEDFADVPPSDKLGDDSKGNMEQNKRQKMDLFSGRKERKEIKLTSVLSLREDVQNEGHTGNFFFFLFFFFS